MKRRARGFTLVELLVTLALVGIAAAIALPFGTLANTRTKEVELRVALRTIRQALDNYKAAADAGAIDKPTGSSGYPPSLDVLVKGVPRSTALGFNATPMVFLRKVPRDPFFDDKTVPAAQSWNIRSYGAQPGDFAAGADVFDVSSRSGRPALDGTKLSDW
ncbi:type II secretion system protein [Ramlibacter sp.]|uniref:type II secretion system protein n=1 Tax=Ramlibacter sp. TaxID=1917967 RepID=UPI0017980788|nr:type II secretion system protein [Ramlibacter sp.]MBA2674826.1 type II secretion system protein [Ramlibacter sp.]